MTIKAIGADSPDWTLEELSQFVWGNEIVWGQASQIGNDGETTVVIFSGSHIPEAVDETTHAAVVLGSVGPPGATALLCAGKAFVEGSLKAVSVFRV